MKMLIPIVIGLLLVGCGAPADNTTKPTPQMGLTLSEKVVGTYEIKEGGETYRAVFLANGFVEDYENGKKLENKSKWKIAKGELHVTDGSSTISAARINKDGSITHIAYINKDGKREDVPKDNQTTLKRIK